MSKARISLEEALSGRRVTICCGSGGVGKTSIAASLAVFQAKRHGKTACLTVDPARRLLDTLGDGNSEGAFSKDYGRLPVSFFMANPEQAIREFAARIPFGAGLVTHDIFLDAARALTGSQDFLALKDLSTLVSNSQWKRLVIDTPPTRDALNFFSSPGRLLDFLDSAIKVRNFFDSAFSSEGSGRNPFALGIKKVLSVFDKVIGLTPLRAVMDFGTVVESVLSADLVREKVKQIADIMTTPETGFLLVAAPTKASIDEALYFRRRLKQKGLHFCGVVVNKVFPAAEGFEQCRKKLEMLSFEHPSLNPELIRQYQMACTLADAERALLKDLSTRLDPSEFLHTVPLLAGDVSDKIALEAIEAALSRREEARA